MRSCTQGDGFLTRKGRCRGGSFSARTHAIEQGSISHTHTGCARKPCGAPGDGRHSEGSRARGVPGLTFSHPPGREVWRVFATTTQGLRITDRHKWMRGCGNSIHSPLQPPCATPRPTPSCLPLTVHLPHKSATWTQATDVSCSTIALLCAPRRRQVAPCAVAIAAALPSRLFLWRPNCRVPDPPPRAQACGAVVCPTSPSVLRHCPPGYFCPEGTGARNQNPCPAGTYTDDVQGLISLEQCRPCPVGHYCPFRATVFAVPCKPGPPPPVCLSLLDCCGGTTGLWWGPLSALWATCKLLRGGGGGGRPRHAHARPTDWWSGRVFATKKIPPTYV